MQTREPELSPPAAPGAGVESPDSNATSWLIWLHKPVSMRIGMEAVAGFSRNVSQTANPFNPGIITSSKIKSGDTV